METNTNDIVNIIINAILIFLLIISIRKVGKANSALDIKVEVNKKKDSKYKNCHINHMLIVDRYVAVYGGEYPFLCVGGYYTLHSTPSFHHQYETKQEAKDHLDRYLEWRGKDVIRLEVES